MTDRAAPGAQGSTVRNMEYGEMGGAPAPFIVPFDSQPSRSAQRWDDLTPPEEASDNPERGPFRYAGDVDGEAIFEVQAGEGYVDGWFATDERKQVDVTGLQQEEVTVVAGWDPDAVYSSDIHNTREEADSVFVDVEQNVASDMPYIPLFTGTIVDDGDGGLDIDLDEDLRPIGRPMETLGADATITNNGANSKGPGVNLLRGRPTTFTGEANVGVSEAPVNALRAEFARAPVNTDATQGDVSMLSLLKSGIDPAVYVERTMDGFGGAYNNNLQSGLGTLSRLNANLSWQVSDFSSLTYWSSDSNGGTYTFELTDYPRRVSISHDGSSNEDVRGAILGEQVVNIDSLGAFRMTFSDVSFTANDGNQVFTLGLSTSDTSDVQSGDDYIIANFERGDDTVARLVTDAGGTINNVGLEEFDWSVNHDVSFEWSEEQDVGILIDGEFIAKSQSDVPSAVPLNPVMELQDDGDNTTSETLEVEQISIEPLPEVLN